MARAALILTMAILSASLLTPPAAALETIGSATTRTVTIAANSHDGYQVNTPSDGSADIEFTAGAAGSNVDFYVMTASGYADYLDPSAPSFAVVDSLENAKSFTYSTTESGLIFVVDNADVSTSGAPGTDPVTYVIEVSFPSPTGGPTALSLALASIAAAAVFGSIAAILVRQRKRKRAAAAGVSQPMVPSPYGGAPLPLPPPPTDEPLWSTPTPLASGAIRRTLTPAEQGMLVRDWTKQKGKAAALPIFGLVLSVVFTMYPSFVMIGLLIPAFLAPVVAHAFAKHRRAIAAGRAIEFHGTPVVAGTEQGAKQPFYRLLFGTEPVSVSPGLYGRLVPNQPNTLTVLEGVNTVLAVNGVPLPSTTERVRLPTPAKGLAGVP